MGALAFEQEAEARRRRQQPRLFAVPGGAVADPPAAREPDLSPPVPSVQPAREEPLMPMVLGGPSVRRTAAPRTLDAVVGDLFATVTTGRQATCLFCGGAVRPRPTAAGAAGTASCGDCGTSFR